MNFRDDFVTTHAAYVGNHNRNRFPQPLTQPIVLAACPTDKEWGALIKELRRLGIQVDTVASGRKCVERALDQRNTFPYHAVIASLDLADLDGFSVVSLLRENKYRLPTLTVCSKPHYALEELSLGIGANAHFHLSDVAELSCFITSLTQLELREAEAA